MFKGAAGALDGRSALSAAVVLSGGLGARHGCPDESGLVRRALQTGTGEEWRDEDTDGVVRRDDIVNAPHEASVSSGTLAVIRPSRIVLRYTQPDERVVLIDGDMMTMSWPSRHLRESRTSALPRSESEILRRQLPDELRSHFTIAAREAKTARAHTLGDDGAEAETRSWRVCRAWICGWIETTELLVAMKMSFPSGDTKLMTFTEREAQRTDRPVGVQRRAR